MRVAALVCLVLLLTLFFGMALDLIARGGASLTPTYLFEGVSDAGRAGGVGPVIVSTLAVVLLAIAFAMPLALGAAMLCGEVLMRRPRLRKLARGSLDIMVSVPSVAVGLVGWTLFSEGFGIGFSLLSGSLTLALMLTPILSVAFIVGFERVDRGLRSECLALGVNRWTTFWRQVVPAARPALLAGVVLAVGRATAETAALVLTSGISTRMPGSLLDPGATLAVHVYHLARDVPGGESRAYTAALTLFAISVGVQLALVKLRRKVVAA